MQVIFPQNATKAGCCIYWTGSDVSSLYNQVTGSLSGRRLQSTRWMLDCSGSAGAGELLLTIAACNCLTTGAICK